MHLKLTYENLEIEAEFETLEEKNEVVKLIKYTINDLTEDSIKKSLAHYKKEQVEDDSQDYTQPTDGPASEGQINYMNQLGIEYSKDCTKFEAIKLINEWKMAHGIKVNRVFKKN